MNRKIIGWIGVVFAGFLISCETPYLPYVHIESNNYLIQLPQNYGVEAQHPLIVFLHGAGCGSMEMDVYKDWGLGRYADANPDFPFVVVAPQTPTNWYSEPLGEIIDEVTAEYNIDTNRIYVTGFSMGGYGTFMLALTFPHKFAAIAPVCGYSAPSSAERIKHLPIWMFHDAGDPVVPFSESQTMFQALQAVGGNAQMTVYLNGSHDAWTETYANPDLYDWFLSHTRQDTAVEGMK